MRDGLYTRWLRVLWVLAFISCHAYAQAQEAAGESRSPLLLRNPALSRTHVAFSYAGDIWIANRDGSEPRQLTSGGYAARPAFSPDGSQVAFIGLRDGVRNVYVVSIDGSAPRRLTFHPADLGEMRMNRTGDMVGWTPDGQRIVFSARRTAFASGVVQLFTVPASGGAVEPVPLVRAAQAAFSPDGTRIAYVPNTQWQPEWKRYRGGQTTSIWIADSDDSRVELKIPRENSNDFNPMWVGDRIYFLSDRSGPVTLYSYDLRSGEVRRLVDNDGLDFKSASSSSDAIVYEQFGSLHLLDLRSGSVRQLDIRPDYPEVLPHFRSASQIIESGEEIARVKLSPRGGEVAFDLRGEILLAGEKKSHGRNLTQTPGSVERDPAWSPDGRSIAYFSDASGEYALQVRDPQNAGALRTIGLGDPPSFYFTPIWSPDSRKIGYTDKRLNYWIVDVEQGTRVRVDTDLYVNPAQRMQFAWSPDSRWLAYTKQLPSHLHAVFLYSIERGRSYQLTDGMSDALHVAFDNGGEYLYFTSSTDASMKTGLLRIPSVSSATTRSVHAVLLAQALPHLAVTHDAGGDGSPVKTGTVEGTCFDRIARFITTLPVPERNYVRLVAGPRGRLFLVERVQATGPLAFSPSGFAENVYRFDPSTGRTVPVLDEVRSFELSFDGARMLYSRRGDSGQDTWFITSAPEAPHPSRKLRDGRRMVLDSLEVPVDPRLEWRHMFEQVWRNQRDFFYDPGLHGLDYRAIKQRYEPYLPGIASRDDLDYLFSEMLGNLSVDHVAVAGPQTAAFRTRRSKTGLLGADYVVRDGRYCFERLYERDVWDPRSRSPLTEPGTNVEAGECLLAVDGREVTASVDVYSYFEGTAGKSVVLTVGPASDGTGSRDITVVPLDDEVALRRFAWVDDNRRTVDLLTQGRVAYVYVPDVSALGYQHFNRYYFAQAGREAVILDERFNAGGIMADYMIDYLRRPLLNHFHMRDGRDISTPMEGIFGPRVMIINELAGSGGDHLPWLFRSAGLGPLVGKRTWGGLIGGATNPDDLLDGGFVGTPNLAFYSPEGSWDVANHSVAPDFEVEEDPHAARTGRDLQLEKAVEVALDMLERNPPRPALHPPYRHMALGH